MNEMVLTISRWKICSRAERKTERHWIAHCRYEVKGVDFPPVMEIESSTAEVTLHLNMGNVRTSMLKH